LTGADAAQWDGQSTFFITTADAKMLPKLPQHSNHSNHAHLSKPFVALIRLPAQLDFQVFDKPVAEVDQLNARCLYQVSEQVGTTYT
jgi:hypothetical protein